MSITKEEKIIENSKSILEGLLSEHTDDSFTVIEYEKLLKNYIKLNKQFYRTLKLGDATSKSTLDKNKKTISMARDKIISSVAQQRKLKEQLSLGSPADKKQIDNLTKHLKAAMMKIELLEAKLNKPKHVI